MEPTAAADFISEAELTRATLRRFVRRRPTREPLAAPDRSMAAIGRLQAAIPQRERR